MLTTNEIILRGRYIKTKKKEVAYCAAALEGIECEYLSNDGVCHIKNPFFSCDEAVPREEFFKKNT